MHRIRAALTGAWLSLCALPAGAEPPLRPEEDTRGTFSMMLENDIFSNTDKHYTNGVRFAWLSPESAVPEMLERWAARVPLFAGGGRRRYSLALGQSMFTPEDITVAMPQPGRRPYSGWLYGSVGLVSDTGTRLDNLELTVGMVGPSSFAEQTQKFVHEVIDSPDPKGWDTQLRDEPGMILTYERKYRALAEVSPFGLAADLTPHIGGSIGNVFTHGAVGLTARVGRDLPADYGPPRIRPSLPGSDFFVPTKTLGWYVFAGWEGRAVARNIFLDGNTFRDSPSVDKEPFIHDIQAGIAMTYGRARVAYTQIWRSREFTTQTQADAFGAVTVSLRF